MQESCSHLNQIHDVSPNTAGCEECLKMGDSWVHLRLCKTCGHVGCCDSSPGRHAKTSRSNNHSLAGGFPPLNLGRFLQSPGPE